MNGSRFWGALGILVAVLGVVIIAPDAIAGLSHGGLMEPTVLYGLGVAGAAALTLAIVLPSMVRG